MSSLVVVQQVDLLWTKESRGGPGATDRSRLPESFPLPDGAVWHHVRLDEQSGFEPDHSSADALPGDVPDRLGLRWVDDRLSVLPRLHTDWMPVRHRRPPRRSVAVGEVLRWQVNHRTGLQNQWRYRQITWNVVALTGPLDRRILLRPPDHLIDERAALR